MPQIIGHRGASAYRPENTIASFELAWRLGAPYIELDVVSTKDGELVVLHDSELSGTTDVAEREEFAARRRELAIEGVREAGWFTEDFTASEIATLRAKERIPFLRPGSAMYDGRFAVPTLDEALAAAWRFRQETGHPAGVVVELKHAAHFDAAGLGYLDRVRETLAASPLADVPDGLVIETFEPHVLASLAGAWPWPLVQLAAPLDTYPKTHEAHDDPLTRDLLTDEGLDSLATFAHGVSLELAQVLTYGPDGPVFSDIVERAHARGLAAFAYTVRTENFFLPPALWRASGTQSADGAQPWQWGDAMRLFADAAAAGLDYVFTDSPDAAVVAYS